VVAYSAAAFAEPVTKADLGGKKICWSDGWATYGKNGSFEAQGCGHGTWRLVGDRVQTRANLCTFDFTISKDNGTFHGSGSAGANGTYDAWGKYCK
jgi:hypothetical protein